MAQSEDVFLEDLFEQLPRAEIATTHAELFNVRANISQDKETQAKAAPAEHRAFAREWTKENPMVAVPSLLAAIPLYSIAKATGIIKARSPASIDEVAEGYRGLMEGLMK